MRRYRPVVLGVLDGWGIAPDGPSNAVRRGGMPRLDALAAGYPRSRLHASGRAVGLPDGVMGNSEVGHLTMGAGLVHYQDLVRINDAIADGSLARNQALVAAARAARSGTLHLLGLLSTGGVHADVEHLRAVVEIGRAEGAREVVFHAFLDGRDMPPRSALELLPRVNARIATIQGRYYAMDRDERWDRTARAWRAIVDADAPRVATAADAVRSCYAQEACRDELLEPFVVGAGARVADGDGVVFLNFRPDRARQLTRAFLDAAFAGFGRVRVPRVTFATMSDYNLALPGLRVAFPRQPLTPLAALVAERGLRQYHAAETEKYAHVTYFFNGGVEEPFPNEERTLVPSPKVATYDLAPAMSAAGVADAMVDALESGRFDFAVFNLANLDMVGHTGSLDAVLTAMRATDVAVGRIADAVLAAGGCLLLTGDHGNAEEMIFPDGGANTQHTTNPVPLILVAADAARFRLRDGGLVDVAPTLLSLLGIPRPATMTGRSLLEERG
ncbi:MAG: 2,3-bisphosphoglycerate-independent phosphoglycerate mutase [Deltaproteobacteria bacterium]|nr:2,3-bisphosphoglycerate-independent phosphoglycerate mutase [Deltaproteobacteria bacterium]